MPFEYIPLIKAAIGIATAGYALKEEGTTKKFIEAAFSETFGGIIADFTKDSARSLYGKLELKYRKKGAIDKNALNHDLQKAARKAQLIATFFAAQDCLEKVRLDNAPEVEKGRIGKFYDYAKTKIQGTDAVEVYLEGVVKYLNREIESVETAFVSGEMNFEEFNAVFDIYGQAVKSQAQKDVAKELKSDILDEIKFLPKYDLEFRDDVNSFKILSDAINDGWDNVPRTKILSKHFVSLNIDYAAPNNASAKNEWFRLVRVIFNEEYKENSKIEAAAQKQVLLEILSKVNKFGTLKNTSVKQLTAQISAFANDLKYIREGIDKANEGINEIKEGQKRIEEKISEIVSPMPGNISPDFVNLPEMRTDIFGREQEITAIEGFLRDEKEHLIIAAWTCLGKTSLLTKFLDKNLNESQNESLLPDIFGKVIYLDCRRYDTFAGIAQHFATLLDMSLEFTEGREDEFLKTEIFPNIRDSKILLILDNFEAWQSDGDYKTREIGVFLNTIFHTHNTLRLIFLSWHLPHNEHEFTEYVSELDFVREKLFEGLPDDIAVKLVREEGKKYCKANNRVDLNTVSEADLIAFFKDVHNIPQAIRSMVHFVGRKQISFRQFTNEYREKYKFEESDATNLADRRGNLLRPTNAMIGLQISLLNEKAKNLLRHIAFYGIDVPEDILVLNESDIEQTDDNLRDELLHLSNDGLAIADVNRNDNVAFVQYHLHPFVFEAVRDNLLAFSDTHETYLESIANQMRGKNDNAWENKLFYKQLALAECWEKLEDCLIQTLNHSSRQFQRNSVDFNIALASQEIANAFAVKLTDEQRKQLHLKSEKLYLDYLKKNPNYAEAYNNLGNLLAKDENRQAEAEAKYLTAIELNPNDAEAYNNLGILLAKDENRQAEAEANFLKAIELNPNFAEAYNNLGILLDEDESRWKEAEAAFRKAIELNPNDASVYFNLACLRSISLKDEYKDEAFEFLRKAIELNSKNKELAKTDADFDFLRDDVRFAKMVDD